MPKQVYWDSCVFLDYIEGDPAKLPVLDALLDEARTGSLHIYTSVFSVTEVAFAHQEKTGKALDPAIEAEIDKLWADRQVVTLVELFEAIARQARDLMRAGLPQGWNLKGKDAVHLATARYVGVSEIHTYEPRWRRYAQTIGIPILEPYIAQPPLPLPPNP
jgi:predicted nucleic acid-binding protein